MGQEVQFASDQNKIVVVQGVKGYAELETCCPNRSLHCREIGIGASGLPSRHYGLMTAEPVGELGLGETCPLAGLADEKSCRHGLIIAEMIFNK